MRVRIESYNEWAKLFVDGKCVDTGHNTGYFEGTILDLLRQLGAEVEDVSFYGDARDPYGDDFQQEDWHDPDNQW